VDSQVLIPCNLEVLFRDEQIVEANVDADVWPSPTPKTKTEWTTRHSEARLRGIFDDESNFGTSPRPQISLEMPVAITRDACFVSTHTDENADAVARRTAADPSLGLTGQAPCFSRRSSLNHAAPSAIGAVPDVPFAVARDARILR
jgi:hypothetical protein